MLSFGRVTVRLTAVVLCLAIVFSSGVAQAFSFSTTTSRAVNHAYIPAGTIVPCELITPLNSGRNYQGERVLFKTTGAVQVNSVTVIPIGAAGEAIVSEVKKAGAFGKGGKIAITTRSVKAVNGVDVPVAFNLEKSGGGEGGWVIPAFLVISIFAGFVRGKNQDLPAGTRFSVAVESDYDLGCEPDQLAEVMIDPNSRKTAVAPAAPQKAAVPDIMTVDQAAAYLQVSPETVHYLINEGKLRAIKVGDGYRIKKSDIDNM
ncbi:helix-turn-helix domain-containing protein [Anaeroselena agilis]|uniref:Helix-turn-helix domain-containing protein n=1 Tax=Anaeroselena agilis TaxID=3063788 RepID=A0ABU3P4L7_9FIRM|nr:helix-turn-helix domain-containing protein [Selenomonadales bacterium 4137-cl]